MKIIVAGGTGFIGTPLITRLLRDGHAVTVLTRSPKKIVSSHNSLSAVQWDAKTQGGWVGVVDGADAIINLTGELIAGKRWTRRQKDVILASRVESTRALVTAIEHAQKKPSVLINNSAVGFYGDVPDGDVSETAPAGTDFLAQVCLNWEAEALMAKKFGVRVVTPRLGVVLAPRGGALARLVVPFRFFAGGYVGTGRQWFPWIHIDDLIGGFVFLLAHPSVEGPVNFVAPHAVTMKEFARTVGEVMHRPSWTSVPSFVLRIALGEMAEMLLTGQRVIPQKLLEAGYRFEYATANGALTDILKRQVSMVSGHQQL
ncbi:MAG TPA: TIGR01777 family oxidoreductase [Bacteroidota bacterium]|nr:TIGR01777 family oxidoreductase [Bacteroidota bacterium]